MPRKIKVPELSGMPEKAAARFKGWLAIEKARIQSEREPDLAMLEIEWDEWNTKPEANRSEINTKLAFNDKKIVPWPLEWKPEFFDERRYQFARLASLCSKADISQLRQVHSSLSEPHWSDVQTMTGAWEDGEGVRCRERRVDCTRKHAERILARRLHAAETGGFESSEHYPATFGLGCGKWNSRDSGMGCHAWFDRERAAARVHVFDDQTQLKTWKAVEKLLPVFYEVARQSPTVLQWAVMAEIVLRWRERVVEPRWEIYESQRAWPMHPLEQHERKFHNEMRGRVGGFSDGLAALAKYLVKDTPFALIPLVDRKHAARHVINCNQSHRHFGPLMSDAGEVSDPLAAKEVERDHLRLAKLEEATQKVKIPYSVRYIFGEGLGETAEKKVFAIPDASLAVKMEAGEVIGAAANVAGEIECNEAICATTEDGLLHTRREKVTVLPKREIAEDGSEVLALRIVWKETRDADLRDEFEKLLKKLRPRKSKTEDPPNCWPQKEYPEGAAIGSGKDSRDYEVALQRLISLRHKRSLEIRVAKLEKELESFIVRDAAGMEKHKEMINALEMLKAELRRTVIRSRDREGATTFYNLTTGDELPWWDRAGKEKSH